MDVRNWKSCGKMFNYISGAPLCPGCNAELEKKFQKVKEYIQENKSVPLSKIAEDNEVTVNQLKRWVREERLIFSEDSVEEPSGQVGFVINVRNSYMPD